MKTGYRRATAGVVGCLLVGSTLGGAALAHERPVPVVSSNSPSAASLAFDSNTTATDTPRLQRHVPQEQQSALAVATYTVQQGDSLWSIADDYGTDPDTLQALNGDQETAVLQPGQSLKVIHAFHGVSYAVQPGDTLTDVALAYGITVDEIRQANGLESNADLREGETLFLPGARPRSNMVVSRGDYVRRTSPPPAAAEEKAAPAVAAAPKPAPAPAQAPAAAPAPAPAPAPAAAPAPAPATAAAAHHADATYIWPLNGPVTSEFGHRDDIGDFHEGIDIYAPVGTVVVAARGGTVEVAGWSGGYGLCIVINHGDGTKTKYAHSSELLVEVGQTVKQGQAIMKVGTTGHVTGPHLHFEVIVDGTSKNPRNYLP